MEKYKKSYKNNKFKISAPKWYKEFELPDGPYTVSDIQYFFKYILNKHGEKTVNPTIKIYVNKIENRITFKIKTVYYFELLTPETMKVLAKTKSNITKDQNGLNVLYLEMTEVVLAHCNIVIDDYQIQESCINLFLINRLFNS